jgi:hypothetical protein
MLCTQNRNKVGNQQLMLCARKKVLAHVGCTRKNEIVEARAHAMHMEKTESEEIVAHVVRIEKKQIEEVCLVKYDRLTLKW